MGDDALSNRLRHEAKHFDTGSTVGALIIEITGEGPRSLDDRHQHKDPRPTQKQPRPRPARTTGREDGIHIPVGQTPRHARVARAVDREICIHEGLGDLLFITEEGKALRNALAYANAGECRWVSTSEREQRQRGLW